MGEGGGGAGAELALWDLVWVISNSFLSLLPKFFGVNLGLLIHAKFFFFYLFTGFCFSK